mmetsp:Transcript_25539/g.64021  ORF Transcript_25539/g.64021 Transcript_25539/m.64021 type:complete len:519 (+) Transcript_25539:2535-4091(+)
MSDQPKPAVGFSITVQSCLFNQVFQSDPSEWCRRSRQSPLQQFVPFAVGRAPPVSVTGQKEKPSPRASEFKKETRARCPLELVFIQGKLDHLHDLGQQIRPEDVAFLLANNRALLQVLVTYLLWDFPPSSLVVPSSATASAPSNSRRRRTHVSEHPQGEELKRSIELKCAFWKHQYLHHLGIPLSLFENARNIAPWNVLALDHFLSDRRDETTGDRRDCQEASDQNDPKQKNPGSNWHDKEGWTPIAFKEFLRNAFHFASEVTIALCEPKCAPPTACDETSSTGRNPQEDENRDPVLCVWHQLQTTKDSWFVPFFEDVLRVVTNRNMGYVLQSDRRMQHRVVNDALWVFRNPSLLNTFAEACLPGSTDTKRVSTKSGSSSSPNLRLEHSRTTCCPVDPFHGAVHERIVPVVASLSVSDLKGIMREMGLSAAPFMLEKHHLVSKEMHFLKNNRDILQSPSIPGHRHGVQWKWIDLYCQHWLCQHVASPHVCEEKEMQGRPGATLFHLWKREMESLWTCR